MESVTPSILKKLIITVLMIGYRKIPRNSRTAGVRNTTIIVLFFFK